MGFWDLSDGESALENEGKEFEQPTGNLDPIPDGSSVLAVIDDAKWDRHKDTGNEFIALRWSVVKPEDYENRKIFQKLWVTDDDPNVSDPAKMDRKRDNAKRMLRTIDTNAGGKLARTARKPSDDDLALALMNKPMVIKCMVWDMNGNSGNWIAGVFPKSKGIDVKEAKAPARKASEGKTSNKWTDDDDDIPFD